MPAYAMDLPASVDDAFNIKLGTFSLLVFQILDLNPQQCYFCSRKDNKNVEIQNPGSKMSMKKV